ncbi:MAG: tRNA (adenosine(37)-N6)-threonylcarbamoyltransferase complex dimerization subunit type 1 TsaB [Christensenellaceae bacterium]|nr:tRNA (adenosine(37)-N6)-threonylcarbamoyltransferase complex dimerization subunit type 1 TsaB [Christensenellaceae bacterium]
MKILSIDTSAKTCSAAVCEDNKILSAKTLDEGLTHSETLMPLIDEMLLKAGVDIADIELIACVNGPGSFTGLRIGICAAKGFAQTLDIPLVEIDTLELLSKNAGDFDGLVVPMLDARRGQVYAAIFENGKRVSNDMAEAVEDVVKLTEGKRALFLGDGAVALKEKILAVKSDAKFTCDNFTHAEKAVGIALESVKTDAFGIMPNYLRKSQAERKKDESYGN